jgi:hypothetical protein
MVNGENRKKYKKQKKKTNEWRRIGWLSKDFGLVNNNRNSKPFVRSPPRGVYFLNLSTVTGQPVKQAEEHNMILC